MARVLIVDDESSVLSLISAALRNAGHEVKTARHRLYARAATARTWWFAVPGLTPF